MNDQVWDLLYMICFVFFLTLRTRVHFTILLHTNTFLNTTQVLIIYPNPQLKKCWQNFHKLIQEKFTLWGSWHWIYQSGNFFQDKIVRIRRKQKKNALCKILSHNLPRTIKFTITINESQAVFKQYLLTLPLFLQIGLQSSLLLFHLKIF